MFRVKNSLLPVASLGSSIIRKIARRSGWLRRRSQSALDPVLLVQALIASVAHGRISLREIAIEIGLLSSRTISKQGLSKRINAQAVRFIKQLTSEALCKAASTATTLSGQIVGVRRILISDSTSLNLHESLAEHFPGATNHTPKTAAQVRLQVTVDLLGGHWLEARPDPYKRNDHQAAMDIVESILRKKDLVIRDLGYASARYFRAVKAKGAFFLSRLSSNIGVFSEDGEKLDVMKLARTFAPCTGDTFSRKVQISTSEHFECRLVVIRLPQEVGDRRRRELNRKAKDRGLKPYSKRYLAMQDWLIFVTNLDEDQVTDDQVHELYQMRWRIESIFKLCKSHTSLRKAAGHRTNRHHAELLVWSCLLMMTLLSTQGLFRLSGSGGRKVVEISIFKSIARVLGWFALSIEISCAGSIEVLMERLIRQQSYHDRYETRTRISMPDRLKIALGDHFQELLG